MSTINQRRGSTERFWRATLRQWRRGGLSVREFCRQHGLAEPSFYCWRRTLAERDAAQPRFVPVRVATEAKAGTPADASAGAVELVLDAGRRLRIGPGFDAPTLQRLLALLEEGQP